MESRKKTSPIVRLLVNLSLNQDYLQYAGGPYIADETHDEDTLFFVFEPDFVFLAEDAKRHQEFLSQQEAVANLFSRYAEIADSLNPLNRDHFMQELEEYLKRVQVDHNAQWPLIEKHRATTWNDATHRDFWEVETSQMGDRMCAAFHRPKKPRLEDFKPEAVSEHLKAASVTLGSRSSRN